MKKIFLLCAILILCTSCSEFTLLISGASAASQNAYARAYSGVDMLTIMSTEKSIKKHAYDKTKELIDDRRKWIKSRNWKIKI